MSLLFTIHMIFLGTHPTLTHVPPTPAPVRVPSALRVAPRSMTHTCAQGKQHHSTAHEHAAPRGIKNWRTKSGADVDRDTKGAMLAAAQNMFGLGAHKGATPQRGSKCVRGLGGQETEVVDSTNYLGAISGRTARTCTATAAAANHHKIECQFGSHAACLFAQETFCVQGGGTCGWVRTSCTVAACTVVAAPCGL